MKEKTNYCCFYYLLVKENNVNVKELFSSIKYNVDNYIERPIIISDKINKVNLNKLDSKLLIEGLKYKLLCIQSEKGTGKTTSLINNLLNQIIIRQNQCCLYLVERHLVLIY